MAYTINCSAIVRCHYVSLLLLFILCDAAAAAVIWHSILIRENTTNYDRTNINRQNTTRYLALPTSNFIYYIATEEQCENYDSLENYVVTILYLLLIKNI